MLALAISLVVSACLPRPAAPQDPAPPTAPTQAAAPRPADVMSADAVVKALYATISGPPGPRDWQRLRSLFAPDGRLAAIVPQRGGGVRTALMTVDDYVRRAGPRLEQEGFFEQEIARTAQVFGDLAHVFSTYEIRRSLADAKPLLRGINSIQLVRLDGRWAVLQILWEQEEQAGPIPAEFLPAPGGGDAPAPLAVKIVGSDLLLAFAAAWGDAYLATNPDVATTVVGGGTGTGFAAFAKGDTAVTLAARRPRDAELAAARASGAEPLEICFGYRVGTVAVPLANPLASLDLEQLRSVFATDGALTRWSQLGVTLPGGGDDAIAPVCPPAGTGPFLLLQRRVLQDAQLRREARQIAPDAAIPVDLRNRPGGIAWLASPEAPEGLRVVPIAAAAGRPAIAPTPATCADGSYPLAEPLYVYFRDEPSGRVKAFVKWLASDAGKALIARHGFVPR